MQVRFRPISLWPGTVTPAGQRRSGWTFKAGWRATLELLERELGYLGARVEYLILEWVGKWPPEGFSMIREPTR